MSCNFHEYYEEKQQHIKTKNALERLNERYKELQSFTETLQSTINSSYMYRQELEQKIESLNANAQENYSELLIAQRKIADLTEKQTQSYYNDKIREATIRAETAAKENWELRIQLANLRKDLGECTGNNIRLQELNNNWRDMLVKEKANTIHPIHPQVAVTCSVLKEKLHEVIDYINRRDND